MTEATGERRPADETFALLGNETRVAILFELWEAHEPLTGASDAVPFSALRDRVGVADSGQFNYHLDRLTGAFVEQTDAGYQLRQRGLAVVRAVVAGTVGDDPTLEPTVVDEPCPRCGAPTTVSYADDHLYHACTECPGYHGGTDGPFPDGTLAAHPFAPAGLEGRSPEAILAAERRYAKHQRAAMVDGVCPECSGPVDAETRVCDDHDPGDGVCDACGTVGRVRTRYVCAVCKNAWLLGPQLRVATHPAVVGFHYERGHTFDVAAAGSRVSDWTATVERRDPLRVRVTVPVEGDELHLTLDGEMDVVAVED